MLPLEIRKMHIRLKVSGITFCPLKPAIKKGDICVAPILISPFEAILKWITYIETYKSVGIPTRQVNLAMK
jgi:hypothetical protein